VPAEVIVVGGADDDDLYGGEFKTYADVLAEADGAGGGGEMLSEIRLQRNGRTSRKSRRWRDGEE
jgi:hypothetical protein